MIGSGDSDSAQVYNNDGTLVFLNHASDNCFGGIGFNNLQTEDQLKKFATMLIKLITKLGSRIRREDHIKRIAFIGCDVSGSFAQYMADSCKIQVVTLKDLHKEYDRILGRLENNYRHGYSLLQFIYNHTYFVYGYVFYPDSNTIPTMLENPLFLQIQEDVQNGRVIKEAYKIVCEEEFRSRLQGQSNIVAMKPVDELFEYLENHNEVYTTNILSKVYKDFHEINQN